MTVPHKPIAQLTKPATENPYAVLVRAKRALRRNGLWREADEMAERVHRAIEDRQLAIAYSIIAEYVVDSPEGANVSDTGAWA